MTSSVTAQRILPTLTGNLVDESVGVLRSLEEVRSEVGSPQFFHYSATLPNTVELGGQPCNYWTGAASATRNGASLRAITDAVAYYCAAYRFQAVMPPVCSVRNATFPALSPAELDWFDSTQYHQPEFPWRPFDENTPVYWMEAFDPVRDTPIFVPAALVFLPYIVFANEGELPIAPATSTGLACHWSIQQCAIDAICDAIECDALTLSWFGHVPPAQVRVETLSDANYDLVSRFEKTGGVLTLFRMPSELPVVTFLAALSSSSALSPARIFAAGTDLSPEQAVRKSLEMLAHVQQYCHLLHSQMPALLTEPDYPEIVDQTSHLRFWCNHANAHLSDFLFSSPRRIQFDELEDRSTGNAETDLDNLIRQVNNLEFRVLLADITTGEIRHVGLTVLRAIIPRLCPLLYGSRTMPLGSHRLRAAVNKLSSDPNWVPHPFPRRGVLA